MSTRILRLCGLYLIVASGIALIYYRGDRNVGAAVLVGLIAGLAIIPLEMRFMKDRERATKRVLSGFPHFEITVGAAGIALVVLGILIGNLVVVLSGFPFLGIAMVFLVVKYGIRRRSGRSPSA